MRSLMLPGVCLATLCNAAIAELPRNDLPFEGSYRNDLLYVHALVNYAWDMESQFDWERRQFSGNSFRVNTGSVSSDSLFTSIDLRLNPQLNDHWRFVGNFERSGQRRAPVTTEQLLLGFERSIGQSSALFVTLNPEYNKAFMDAEVGYALYAQGREQYLRFSVLLEDFNFGSKNDMGGKQDQNAVSLNWSARWLVADDWYLSSKGSVGSGFARRFADAELSPEVLAHKRDSDQAELRLATRREDGSLWSVTASWADFEERRTFRTGGFDYAYNNSEFGAGAEHIRVLAERHRLRLLASYVNRKASSTGFSGHDYRRQEITGGAFYEFLWPNSGLTLAYALGQPDFDYRADDSADSYGGGDFSDKLIVGWRYRFSDSAEVRASVSHEVSTSGFGGGSVQFQMFF